jgi:hypothetical protein
MYIITSRPTGVATMLSVSTFITVFIIYIYILTIILYTYIYMHTHTETGQKPPGQKAPHNEIIIQSYYIFFYIDGDIKDILKIKTHPY